MGLVCPHIGERQELSRLLGAVFLGPGPLASLESRVPSPKTLQACQLSVPPTLRASHLRSVFERVMRTGRLAQLTPEQKGAGFTRWVPAHQAKVSGGHRWSSPLRSCLCPASDSQFILVLSTRTKRRFPGDMAFFLGSNGKNDSPLSWKVTKLGSTLIFRRSSSGDRFGCDHPILSSNCNCLVLESYTRARFSLVKAFIYLHNFHAVQVLSLKCPIQWR